MWRRRCAWQVTWVEVKEGTGAMLAALKEGKVDAIVALTEGLVADIAKGGSDVRILSTYVQSPLCWAISVGPKSQFHSIEDLKGQVRPYLGCWLRFPSCCPWLTLIFACCASLALT